jgi:outer membrane protein insertion porin family
VQTYLASVTEPWLFDRQLELTVDVYRRGRWFDMYDLYRSGASATLSYPVKFWPTWQAFGRFGARVSAEYIEFDDVEKDRFYNPKTGRSDWRAFKEEEEKYGDKWEIPFRIFWADDTRDSFLFAKKGHKINIYGELVAADSEYWHVGFNYRQYLTVWKKYSHVVSFGLRAETLDTFGGSDKLPIYDRLFLGGPRSIRGVDYREIGPRVWRGKHRHEAWGGKSLFCVTGEYSIPIVQYVRWAFFTDLGSVGKDAWDPEFGDNFCWSVGTGFRLDIPSFPIRLDLAVPIEKPSDGVEKKVFSFNIGFDF